MLIVGEEEILAPEKDGRVNSFFNEEKITWQKQKKSLKESYQ